MTFSIRKRWGPGGNVPKWNVRRCPRLAMRWAMRWATGGRSEQRKQLLLEAEGLAQGAEVAQEAQPQDHRIDVAFLLPATLQMATLVGEGITGRGHGGSRGGAMAGR